MERKKTYQYYNGFLLEWCNFANAQGIEKDDIIAIKIGEPVDCFMDTTKNVISEMWCTVLYMGYI